MRGGRPARPNDGAIDSIEMHCQLRHAVHAARAAPPAFPCYSQPETGRSGSMKSAADYTMSPSLSPMPFIARSHHGQGDFSRHEAKNPADNASADNNGAGPLQDPQHSGEEARRGKTRLNPHTASNSSFKITANTHTVLKNLLVETRHNRTNSRETMPEQTARVTRKQNATRQRAFPGQDKVAKDVRTMATFNVLEASAALASASTVRSKACRTHVCLEPSMCTVHPVLFLTFMKRRGTCKTNA